VQCNLTELEHQRVIVPVTKRKLDRWRFTQLAVALLESQRDTGRYVTDQLKCQPDVVLDLSHPDRLAFERTARFVEQHRVIVDAEAAVDVQVVSSKVQVGNRPMLLWHQCCQLLVV